MARIRGLERDGPGIDRQHRGDDLFERNVEVVRAFVVAPADMHAHLVCRNAFERPVEHVDVQLTARQE